ncbi:MAG: TRAP transporter large permease, partial [Zetaproteobacteria bacterium]
GPNSFVLLAIPFFIFAGNLLNESGVTTRIFDFSSKLVGHIRGGFGHVNVVASIIFAGMSGAAVADAGGLGAIEIKAMRAAKYPERMTIGITAASSAIGPIIPPSLIAVVYASVAQESVGRLFAAGFLPGLVMGLSLMVLIYLQGRKLGLPVEKRASAKAILVSFVTTFWSLVTPGIILGGIFLGVFTPTEAAAVACVYSIVLGFFIYREMSLRAFYRALIGALETTVQVMFIVAAATLFAWILAKEKVPVLVANFMLTQFENYYVILLIINCVLLLVGCFMETVAAINILVPVFLPLIDKLGIDPVHFGIIVILNLTIGLLTPPFGTVLFVLSSVAKVPVEDVARHTAVYLIPLFVVLAVLTLYPPLTLTIPNLLFGAAPR